MRYSFLLLVCCVPTLNAQSTPVNNPDPNLPYQAGRSNPVTYDVDYSVIVTAPYHTKKLRVWMPIPQSDRAQTILKSELSTFPVEVKPSIGTEKTYGNRLAFFEFVNPQGAQIVRHRFRARVYEMRWNLNLSKVRTVKKWPSSFTPYLRSDQVLVVDEDLRRELSHIVGKDDDRAVKMRSVMKWTMDHLIYDHANASLRASSKHALKWRRGHCSDYHGVCAAFGRAIGAPTRVTYGLHLFPKSSPSHCKLEVFLLPYGWVSFDVSETQKLMHRISQASTLNAAEKKQLIEAALRRTEKGFRDNTWLMCTKGTDLQLVPPAKKRAPVIRTIYAEADGVALPDPDPSNPNEVKHAWMTAIKIVPDRKVNFPYKDWQPLKK